MKYYLNLKPMKVTKTFPKGTDFGKIITFCENNIPYYLGEVDFFKIKEEATITIDDGEEEK